MIEISKEEKEQFTALWKKFKRLRREEFEEMCKECSRIEKHSPPVIENAVWALHTMYDTGITGSRLKMIFSSFEKAEKSVLISPWYFECSYDIVFIEPVIPDENPYNTELRSYWYLYDHELKRYFPIETPEDYKNSYGFTVG